MSKVRKVRFARNCTTGNIQKRILKLLETKEFQELNLLLSELRIRKENLRKRIIKEMCKICPICGQKQ